MKDHEIKPKELLLGYQIHLRNDNLYFLYKKKGAYH